MLLITTNNDNHIVDSTNLRRMILGVTLKMVGKPMIHQTFFFWEVITLW